MYVVATAGHVDHGKSTLLRTLTGMEPDRWAEERARGMTIDLGYVWARLPSGERARALILSPCDPKAACSSPVAADHSLMGFASLTEATASPSGGSRSIPTGR